MATESKEQRGTVERVLHEFKQGELRTGRGKGPKVKDRKQAIAIALQESGSTNRQSPSRGQGAPRRDGGSRDRGEARPGAHSRKG